MGAPNNILFEFQVFVKKPTLSSLYEWYWMLYLRAHLECRSAKEVLLFSGACLIYNPLCLQLIRTSEFPRQCVFGIVFSEVLILRWWLNRRCILKGLGKLIVQPSIHARAYLVWPLTFLDGKIHCLSDKHSHKDYLFVASSNKIILLELCRVYCSIFLWNRTNKLKNN